jgi:hypothetical protein
MTLTVVMPAREARCQTCRWWDGNTEHRIDGLCRRFPPFLQQWPVVRPDDWCSQWQPGPSSRLTEVNRHVD